MKVFFVGNNLNGFRVLQYLKSRPAVELVALGIHRGAVARYLEEILKVAELPESHRFEGNDINSPTCVDLLRSEGVDLLVCVNFGAIVREPLLSLPKRGCINLHTSYLPFNRGAYPNVWPIIDETPAGVTLHFMDKGIDTGGIIAQERIEVLWTDTGSTLYKRLEDAALKLFEKVWPKIESGNIPSRNQEGIGTRHFVKDVKAIDCIDLNKTYKARDLINLLRARTFLPHPSAYFCESGKKFEIRVEIREIPMNNGEAIKDK